MRPWRSLAWLVTLAVSTTLPTYAHAEPDESSSPAPPPVRLKRGVVVVASKGASVDETWRLATLVYQQPALRPRGMDDATARALAGEEPPERASPRVRALYELRASLAPTGPTTRRLLGSLGKEIGVSGVVLTSRSSQGTTRGRLFVVDRAAFQGKVLRFQTGDGGRPSWDASVLWLSQLATGGRPATPPEPSGSVFASPWFWGAITAAAGAVIFGYVATRDDEPETIHLQGRVGP